MARKIGPVKRGKAAQTGLSILRLIQARPSISRVELAAESGMSTAAITSIVGSLVSKGILIEGSTNSANVGRKRVGLTLRPSLGHVVGVDMGTFNLRVTVSDLNGRSLVKHEQHTDILRGRDAVLQSTFNVIRNLIAQAVLAPSDILGIGVAFSGVIDVQNGIVLSYPRLGQVDSWRKFPLADLFEQEFGVPCLLEDSVRAIATSEQCVGAGRGYNDFVYVDVGVGIGSSIFIDRKIYRGFGGSAGEFGHMTIDESGPLCCCGNHGCLEAMASGATLIEMVKVAIAKGVSSRVLELAGTEDQITIENIVKAAEDNDSLAFRSLSEIARHIGTACADVINLLNPQAIIFGGALFRAAPHLIDQIKRLIRERAMEKSVNDVTLCQAQTSGDAGAHGMAKLIAEKLLDAAVEKALT